MSLPSDLEETYMHLVGKSIHENSTIKSNLQWKKAVNDLTLAGGLLKISTDQQIKDVLGYSKDVTFFDWTIVCAYYSIFHAAQALLGAKKVKITSRVHHATLVAFAHHYINNKELEEELFLIYEDAEAKAQELFAIIEEEKTKRGLFQYHRLSAFNRIPGENSIKNAQTFLEAAHHILAKKNLA